MYNLSLVTSCCGVFGISKPENLLLNFHPNSPISIIVNTPAENVMGTETQNEELQNTDCIALIDEANWVWTLVHNVLEKCQEKHVRISSSIRLRHSWERVKNAKKIIVYWENKERNAGALIEEILEVAPLFDIADKLIVLTFNPTHEDVVYFSELGIKRIVRIRNRDKEIEEATRELISHIRQIQPESKIEVMWRRVLRAIDYAGKDLDADKKQKLSDNINNLVQQSPTTARSLDALASLSAIEGREDEALQLWNQALDKNPNYYRSYNNLVKFHLNRGELQESFALMQKMQSLNRNSISRLVTMGEIHVRLQDDLKAEHYFKNALERDNLCSGALNGLAEIRFRQGDLEASRNFLSKSSLAYRVAQELNQRGIEMVVKGKYQEAMEHYTKAQYVIPDQQKSPLLFYNIGLCYHKWGKISAAREFLKLALIKEPNYKKASALLEKIKQGSPETKNSAA